MLNGSPSDKGHAHEKGIYRRRHSGGDGSPGRRCGGRSEERRYVTKRVTDTRAQADRWGYIQVTLIVKRTTTTVGTKKTVRRKITGVTVPVYPNHTDRSAYINQQALPWLKQETLAAQFKGNIQLISGATNTSDAFAQSLTAAFAMGPSGLRTAQRDCAGTRL
jgi:hypothetical protein